MDERTPLVTVILPTFQRRSTLPAAIRSIRDQAFRDWKLLVVNDGGEDVSDVIASFSDSRIEYHARPHLGKAAALNHGLATLRSKYVAYMDDDDVVFPDHLAELVAAAERDRSEFVYSDTWLVVLGPDGKERGRRIENDEDVSFDDIRFFNKIHHKQILHTKRLADAVGPYDERMRVLIDYDYIRRLARVCPPVHVRKTTGEHFLRMVSEREDHYDAISGLWLSDPAACSRSVAALLDKDACDLAGFYQAFARTRNELRETEERLTARLAGTEARLAGTEARLAMVESSLSYRIGRAVTFPLRRVAEALRRKSPAGETDHGGRT